MLEALLEIVRFFRANRIDYCLIGGLAMMLHHGRATTVDIDFYVLVNSIRRLRELFEKDSIEAESLGDDQLRLRWKGVAIDLLKADRYLGKEVLQRALEKKLDGEWVRVATVEDLVILKTVANRSIDRRDVAELRELYRGKLDEKYIAKKLQSISKLLKKNLED